MRAGKVDKSLAKPVAGQIEEGMHSGDSEAPLSFYLFSYSSNTSSTHYPLILELQVKYHVSRSSEGGKHWLRF